MNKLAAEVGCTERTVRKWVADSSSVSEAVSYALAAAAKRLKIERDDDGA